MAPAQAPIVEEPEAEAAATAGVKVPDVRPDIAVVIDPLCRQPDFCFILNTTGSRRCYSLPMDRDIYHIAVPPCPVVWNMCLSH